jgi:hypothetical protein
MLASGSSRVSEMVAALPQRLQRQFHHAKALYRFLDNERVQAEALVERVCRESALSLEGEERLVCVDLSPVKKPHARALEGLHPVGQKKIPGYELLTCLGMDPLGHLAVGYARLVAYGEKGFRSLPTEVQRAFEGAKEKLGGANRRLIYVLDRGFDDRKVFAWVLELKEAFVIRVYQDRAVGEGRKLKEVATALELPFQYQARLKVAGKYRQVSVHFGFTAVEVEGQKLTLVVSRVPALGKRGRWWLLTNLPVATGNEAQRVVEAYRQRWLIEDFFRLLKTGLGLEEFQVETLARIRKVVAILLGLAVFLWEVRRQEGPFKAFLLRLGGKLGLKSERDGPYLLVRGLMRLLNYEVTGEELERARQRERRSYG